MCYTLGKLLAYLLRDMTDEEHRAVEKHIHEGCKMCAAKIKFLKRIESALKVSEFESPPDELIERVKSIYPVQRLRKKVAGKVREITASLVYDSYMQPAQATFRSVGVAERQILFKAGKYDIDYRISRTSDKKRFIVAGQLLSRSTSDDKLNRFIVYLKPSRGKTYKSQVGEFGWWDGTSFSSALVTDAVALLRSAKPSLDPQSVHEISDHTSYGIDDLNPDYHGQLGSGRLDCGEAVIEIYITGAQQGEQFGYSIASSDFNDDGYVDIIVGSSADNTGGSAAGAARIFFGDSIPDNVVDFVVVGTPGEFLGSAVASAGDFNDDGIEDFIVTAPFNSDVAGKAGRPEELLTFIVTALDPDGDSVTLTAENLPLGASFVDEGWDTGLGKYKGTFSWTPNSSQIGVYENVRFIATAETLIDDEYIKITIAEYVCGDADGSGTVDIDDVVYLIAYIFTGGPPPDPLAAGDVDCSESVDVDDIVYLIAYIFSGGPEPCADCP